MSATPLQAGAEHAMTLAAPATASAAAPTLCGAPSASVGLYDPSTATFYLNSSNSSGALSSGFAAGPAGAIPIVGDWDGDGLDTVGWYDPRTSVFSLTNSNAAGTTTVTTFAFGPANSGMRPIAGNWTGAANGEDTVGLYNPATSTFYLKDSNTTGMADVAFTYGPSNSGWIPVVGNWTGAANGEDTIGLYSPATSEFYLRNSNTSGFADTTFAYGPAAGGCEPLAGDWTGAGADAVALYNPTTSTFFLKNSNSTGFADTTFNYGSGSQSPAWIPLAGVWPGSAAPSFTATAVSDTQINLSWSTVSGASGYVVDEWIDGAWSQIGSLDGGATDFSVTGLSAGTTYYFDVGAYNSTGMSWANCQSGTTSGGAVTVDHPAAAAGYTPVSGSLFGAGGPSYLDVHQGYVGDCWLMASLAEVAARDPADVQNMFTAAGTAVENGSVVDLYNVRLYNSDGVAGYFTVDTELPAGGTYYDQATDGVLWVALAEKAYAQANGTGWVTTSFEGSDSYDALNGGDPGWALQAITGKPTTDFVSNPSSIAAAWNAGQLIVLGSSSNANDNLIVGDSEGTHAYAVVGYTASSSTPFELYNPWGISSVVGSTVTFNGSQVYGGLFYADANLVAQDFAFQSVGSGHGTTDLGREGTPAAVNAVLAELPHNGAAEALDPTGYQIQQSHPQGVPGGEPSAESRLASTMAAKEAGITDYLHGQADCDWSLGSSIDPWSQDWLLEAKTSI
jgi:hypothetical protein